MSFGRYIAGALGLALGPLAAITSRVLDGATAANCLAGVSTSCAPTLLRKVAVSGPYWACGVLAMGSLLWGFCAHYAGRNPERVAPLLHLSGGVTIGVFLTKVFLVLAGALPAGFTN